MILNQCESVLKGENPEDEALEDEIPENEASENEAPEDEVLNDKGWKQLNSSLFYRCHEILRATEYKNILGLDFPDGIDWDQLTWMTGFLRIGQKDERSEEVREFYDRYKRNYSYIFKQCLFESPNWAFGWECLKQREYLPAPLAEKGLSFEEMKERVGKCMECKLLTHPYPSSPLFALEANKF